MMPTSQAREWDSVACDRAGDWMLTAGGRAFWRLVGALKRETSSLQGLAVNPAVLQRWLPLFRTANDLLVAWIRQAERSDP